MRFRTTFEISLQLGFLINPLMSVTLLYKGCTKLRVWNQHLKENKHILLCQHLGDLLNAPNAFS